LKFTIREPPLLTKVVSVGVAWLLQRL